MLLKKYLPVFLNFFQALSFKEKFSFCSRIFFTCLCAALILAMKNKVHISTEHTYASLFCLLAASIGFGRVPFLIIHVTYMVLLIFDMHLNRAYGLSVFSMSVQMTALLLDTNKTEIIEYLSKINMREFLLLFFVPAISACCLFYKPPFKFSKWVYVLTFIAFPFSYAEHLLPAVAYHVFQNETDTITAARKFKFSPVLNARHADTVVFLIGESHRHDIFKPAFAKYAPAYKNLYYFDDMISLYPSTMKAIPMILSRKRMENRDEKFFKEKSLFSLFEEAGYNTYFLHYVDNADERNHLNFIYNEALHFINFYPPESTEMHDSFIGPELKKILQNDKGKKLIVIKMIGVHDSFEKRHPDDFDTHKPSLEKDNLVEKDSLFLSAYKKIKASLSAVEIEYQKLSIENKEAVMNSYKNAMDYSVSVINGLMEQVKAEKSPALFLFSSDHGICIFEKGSFQLPPECQQAYHIPAMIYLNPALAARVPQKAKDMLACNEEQALTQEYLFETAATLSGISHPAAKTGYDLTRRCAPLKGQTRQVNTMRPDRLLSTYENL